MPRMWKGFPPSSTNCCSTLDPNKAMGNRGPQSPTEGCHDGASASSKGGQAEASRDTRRLVQLWDQLQVRDGVLYRLYEHPIKQTPTLQLVTPTALRQEVMADLHEGVLRGHLGVEITIAQLKERWYWPGYHNDITSTFAMRGG